MPISLALALQYVVAGLKGLVLAKKVDQNLVILVISTYHALGDVLRFCGPHASIYS